MSNVQEEKLGRPTVARAVDPGFSQVITHLMKGVVSQDSNEALWRELISRQAQAGDFVAVLGLEVIVDEAEGYAFLQSLPQDLDDPVVIPRLVARQSLSFHVSLLLALLRKRLAEFDASNADTKLVLMRDQIVEMMRLFQPESNNDARLVDQIDRHVSKVVELGFLRKVPNQPGAFQVQRILKAYVDGQWLSDFDERLAEYGKQFEDQLNSTEDM